MALVTVTAFTAERMLEIENAAVVNGRISGDNLVLVAKDGREITAGNVRGPQGLKGDPGGIFNATPESPGGVQLAGNLTGDATAPRVTGELGSDVDASDAKVTATVSVSGTPTEKTHTLIELLQRTYSVLELFAAKVTKGGKAQTLWSGTLAEYNALPASERNAAGFIAVVVS